MNKLQLPDGTAKFDEALAIMGGCAAGQTGIWSGLDRHNYMCWTRDFCYGACPAFCLRGNFGPVRRHLETLISLQGADGGISEAFLDDPEAWVAIKERHERESGQTPSLLARYREGRLHKSGLGPDDSEVCFLVALFDYVHASGDDAFLTTHQRAVERALNYLRTQVMRNGLLLGCDWRDTMRKELADKALLSNNALLMRVYESVGDGDEVNWLFERLPVHEAASAPLLGAFADYEGAGRIDPFGLSLLRLTTLRTNAGEPAFADACRTVDSPYGVTVKCPYGAWNPSGGHEARVLSELEGVTVRPFIVAYTVLGALAIGDDDYAVEQFQKLHALKGFHEWYDGRDGQGYGAQQKLVSAALYVRAYSAMKDAGLI